MARTETSVLRTARGIVPSPTAIDRTAALFAALSHPVRLGVLALLAQRGTCSAGELGMALSVEASSLSHQLRILKDARLVSTERAGRQILYRIHDLHVGRIVKDAMAHVTEVDPLDGAY